jgi:hypothetical protein
MPLMNRGATLSRIAVLTLAISTGAVLSSSAVGAETQATEWEYPELSVSPRASERLEREAVLEKSKGSSRHWAVQLSAATTLAGGVLQFAQPDSRRDPDKQAAWTGVGVGGAWLIATWLLGSHYTPYTSDSAEVAAIPAKSMREQLVRERTSEQAIENAARMGTRLKWMSFLSNGFASGYMLSKARDDSAAKVVALGSLITSLTPLVFPYHWNDVAYQQQDYKKRIFGPIAVFSVSPSGELAPAFAMQWKL